MSFSLILNQSIAASWLILAVVALRPLLSRAPRAFHCALWALVAIRLVCPVSIESSLSLVPSSEILPEKYFYAEGEDQHQQTSLDVVTNPNYPEQVELPLESSASSLQTRDVYWSLAWLTGMGVMGIYALYSYLNLRLRVRMAVRLRENIWLSDEISSPFLLGLFRPRIYLPSAMEESRIPYVLAHENAHMKRGDHWWKPVGFVILMVHWFNPLVWVAYILLCRDIELACDERVIRDMDTSWVRQYSEALIACSVPRSAIAACPLAFGEVGVKGRIRSMLHYKKPGFWILLMAVILSLVVAVCFMTDPAGSTLGHFPEERFENILEDVEGLTLVQGEHRYETSAAEDILERLREIPVGSTPVSESLSEDRDSSYQIRIGDGKTVLYISGDFSQVWADDGVKPSYSYEIRDPDAMEALLGDFLPAANTDERLRTGFYVSSQCLYMNPVSSYYAFGGDSGCRYEVREGSFVVEDRRGSVTVCDPVDWGWQECPWTEDAFDGLFFPSEVGVPQSVEDCLYQPISTDYFLLLMEDTPVLVETREINKVGRSVWSMYALTPEDAMGSATWQFQPASSAAYPGFCFSFDLDCTHISLSCTQGQLSGGTAGEYDVELPAGEALYWIPSDEDGSVVTEGKIRFTAYNGEEIMAQGVIYIQESSKDDLGVRNYTATIIGGGLVMEQEENGGVIKGN